MAKTLRKMTRAERLNMTVIEAPLKTKLQNLLLRNQIFTVREIISYSKRDYNRLETMKSSSREQLFKFIEEDLNLQFFVREVNSIKLLKTLKYAEKGIV